MAPIGSIVCDDIPGGLTIIGPAEVDLTNFTILCDDTNHNGTVPTGLRIVGQKAQVHGGAVVFCNYGVEVAGQGRHTVEKMDVQANRSVSFFIKSDKNILQRNRAAIDNTGFVISGNNNTLLDNTADVHHDNSAFLILGNTTQLDRNFASHSSFGFWLEDNNGNKLTENEAADNTSVGFVVYDQEKIALRRNRARRNGDAGFEVYGGQKHRLTENEARLNGKDGIVLKHTDKSKLTNNVALNNNQDNYPDAFDLDDNGANCGTNKWKKNTFGTANQPCIR